MATFPSWTDMDVQVDRTSEYAVTEHETISGKKQKTLWSTTPILRWRISIPCLLDDVNMTGAWGTLSEVATLRWFWDQAHGSYGTHTFVDPHTGTSYTVGFVENGLTIRREFPGAYSASYELEQRK